MSRKNIIIVARYILVGFVFFCLTLILYAESVILPFNQYVYHEIDSLPSREIALVFGGGMKAPGVQSDMQLARVMAGIDLYKKGKVKKLVMTGDDGGFKMNEVDYMRAYAIAEGVPVNDIAIDPHGYRTYESCIREANVFGLKDAIVVSQDFHLPRIIYFCRHFGIEAVGFSADYNGAELSYKIFVREALARVKGWLQIEITRPRAMVQDSPQSLF